ncbi:hypothetical protein [[Phormidium] sp. ETS-05]|uniref:hypothetical protein n=1 Tax=[Phormidium] sp. ETS-05 TaxID=222819 RepID=UPI0018EEE993|nr:hypothetical protein [[Phormidium] sp. ETS-05]
MFGSEAVFQVFRSEFEVDDFGESETLINNIHNYKLVIVDFAITPFDKLEKFTNGRELVQYIKSTVDQPPIMMLISGFISKNDVKKAVQMCPEADDFWAKDAGLDSLLERVKLWVQ